ncbi:unnamed protein product [Arctogadus glacialis]
MSTIPTIFLMSSPNSPRKVTIASDIPQASALRRLTSPRSRWDSKGFDTGLTAGLVFFRGTMFSQVVETDSTSCGPFVLKFAECILKDETCKFNTSRKGVEEMRRAIATALLENTDDLTDVCHQCGETDNPEADKDVQWCPRSVQVILTGRFHRTRYGRGHRS